MNKAEKRRQRKKATKAAKIASSVQSASRGQQVSDIGQSIDIALQHHAAGRLPQAEGIYQQILQADPGQPIALHLLGVIALQEGKSDIAVDFSTRALAAKPDFTEAHVNLGSSYKELGRLDEAVASYSKALAIMPDLAEAHYNLGSTLKDLGRLNKAVESYGRALAIKPDYTEAHNNLGNALHDLGRLEDAAACYRKALAIKSDYVEAHNNLGNTLCDLGRMEDAVTSCSKALAIKPDYVEAHNNLGNAFKGLGRLDEAEASYLRALAIRPEFAEAHNNLGSALMKMGRLDEAEASYHKALAVKPDFAEAHSNLGIVLQDQGNTDGAVEQIDLALSYKPAEAGWRIRKALFLPIVPSSLEDIQTRRKTLEITLKTLLKQELVLENPTSEVGMTNFFVAYHNQNNRSLMEDLAKVYIAACPKLTYVAKHCQSGRHEDKDVLRIGFLSSYLRDHTIGKLNRGFIQHLSRDDFEVIVIRPPGKKDQMSEDIDRTANKVVSLCGKLERDQIAIENEKLDILFYLDIGMAPHTYFLAFARLAPIQAVTWGHPDTTGIPNIDYFVSSELLEIPDPSDHYSERLVPLPTVNTYYYRPDPPKKLFVCSDYDLPSDVRLYVCAQTLFKLHPEFDGVLGDLLRRDPDGRLVLIEDKKGGYWRKLIDERFKRAFPDVVDHVIFVPRMPEEKYLGLLNLADALIDIPTFSGGNSSLEAFAMGAPIVAWPSEFLRGRITTALYKQMGLSELIATDADSYLALALRLAQDAEFKRRMRADIEANAHLLFERQDSVRELETFFIAAYGAWRIGDTVTGS